MSIVVKYRHNDLKYLLFFFLGGVVFRFSAAERPIQINIRTKAFGFDSKELVTTQSAKRSWPDSTIRWKIAKRLWIGLCRTSLSVLGDPSLAARQNPILAPKRRRSRLSSVQPRGLRFSALSSVSSEIHRGWIISRTESSELRQESMCYP